MLVAGEHLRPPFELTTRQAMARRLLAGERITNWGGAAGRWSAASGGPPPRIDADENGAARRSYARGIRRDFLSTTYSSITAPPSAFIHRSRHQLSSIRPRQKTFRRRGTRRSSLAAYGRTRLRL
ncbi:v-type ATP synthase beta chain [Striga asiatica]|uniref:V-type ATP synthase beta chain n=1 Tax=Striga asiatica TaxID=4170 RepID=A0A5A7PCM4_STRAF|nr:v-type ATP synthase beta chain [Striga asiatica]